MYHHSRDQTMGLGISSFLWKLLGIQHLEVKHLIFTERANLDLRAFLNAPLFIDALANNYVFLLHEMLGRLGIFLNNWGRKTPKNSSIATSSSRLLCSFCCSMRFCLSASSCLLYSSCSRSCCSWSSCCLRRASDRSLFSCCSLRKSRRRVDSPGTLTMELQKGESEVAHTIKPDGPLYT